MPHEGYDDPVTNDGPGLHSNVPISELTERVTRAIEVSDISSAPPVARNRGRGNAQNSTDPYQSPTGLRGSRSLNCVSYARRVHESTSLDPSTAHDTRIHELPLARSIKLPRLCTMGP